MFELETAIHVLFGSNDVAIWTITATLLSFAGSLVIGIAAYKNAVAATSIAKKASEREDARELREIREEAASAVVQALLTLHMAIQSNHDVPGSPIANEAALWANTTSLDARAQLELLPPSEYPADLHRWFEATWSRMNSLGRGSNESRALVDNYRGQALGDIRGWKHHLVSVKEFASPSRPLR